MYEKHCDVLVIGAGPAGAATALFLARRGYAVILLDRAEFPRDKPCGEYLTPGAVKLLRDELDVLPQMLAEGGRRLTWETVVPHCSRPFGGATDALACPRIVTDRILRDAAESAGAEVIEGFAARQTLRKDGNLCGVQGRDAQGETVTYRSHIVVGADGTHSLLAREMGVVRPIPRLQRIALVTHYSSPIPWGDDKMTMYLPRDRSDACCGVGASCGPESTRCINLVVPISEAPKLAGRRADYWEERLRRSFPQVWELLKDARPVGQSRTIGCFGHHTIRAADHGALLVGDAATFINPFTGEGVYFALRGAQLASETIHQAMQQGDFSQHSLQSYDASRRAELLPRYRLCDAVQFIVHSPSLLEWASERLRRSGSLTDALLQTIGDIARPADLFSLSTLRLALSTL